MKKISYRIFILLIIFVLTAIIYLSFIGVKTDKFNYKISNQIKKIDKNLDIKLKEVSIILNLLEFKLNLKTIGANLIYREKVLEIENIRSDISLKSLISSKFSLTRIGISTKSLNIKNLISFVQLLKNDPKIFIAQRFIKKGYVIADIEIEFDDLGNIKNNYKINGLIKDVKINILNKYDLDQIDSIFEIQDESFKFNDLNFSLNNKTVFAPQIIVSKKNKEYLVSGKINNQKIVLNKEDIKKFIDEDNIGIDVQTINFNSENDFKFKINKNFKIKDLNVNSEINLINLNLKNTFEIKKVFPKVKENIIFENHKIKIKYNIENFSVLGSGKTLIQDKFDNIEYKILKNKNEIEYYTILTISKNLFKLGLLNFEKNGESDLKLNIKAKKKFKKDLIFEELSLKEKNNVIHIKNLILSNDNKIKDIEKIKLEYVDKENFQNKVQMIKKDKAYLIKGDSFNINKIVENLFDSENEQKSSLFSSDLQLNFDINKIHLDQNNTINDLNGYLYLKDNEVSEANLNSKFANQKNIKLTIQTNGEKKITTLFSNEAKPIVDRYKFIKGFKEGSLDFYSVKNNNNTKSTLKIYNFKLKELPALTKILTLASLQGIADLLSGEGIRFDEFEMNFTNKKNLMTISEIYAIGPAISILMDGYVEKKKLVSLRGTLVPATTINKTIASIPVIGDILVGKKAGEGVFGVSFKIKGPPKNLKTTVNPIKTLTPRFITRTLEEIKKN